VCRTQTTPSGLAPTAQSILIGYLPSPSPTLSVRAYTGQQTFFDEFCSGCFYTQSYAWWWDMGAWNGYDSDTAYSSAATNNSASVQAKANPENAVECPVEHIANRPSYSFAKVQYPVIDSKTLTTYPTNVYQRYDLGYWVNLTKAHQGYESAVWQYGMESNQESQSQDVISFHWNSSNNYTDCSF
jgi:hypothetical protein